MTIALVSNNTAHAEGSDKLLELYNMTSGVPEVMQIDKSEITNLEQDLESMLIQQMKNEEYNILVQQYIEKRAELFNDVNNDIVVYNNINTSLAKSIQDNLIEVDIEDLLLTDAKYKSNVDSINKLLDNLNSYVDSYTFRDINFDTESIQEELKDKYETSEILEKEIKEVDNYNLGDVSSIDWIMDNDMHITSGYGYRVDPINTSVISFHSGVDYRASVGTKLKALFNGEVVSCGYSASAGNYINIQSGNNVKYFACHLDSIDVKVGDKVSQYDVIGTTGDTGYRVTGPHLHIALYINGVTYDISKLWR